MPYQVGYVRCHVYAISTKVFNVDALYPSQQFFSYVRTAREQPTKVVNGGEMGVYTMNFSGPVNPDL